MIQVEQERDSDACSPQIFQGGPHADYRFFSFQWVTVTTAESVAGPRQHSCARNDPPAAPPRAGVRLVGQQAGPWRCARRCSPATSAGSMTTWRWTTRPLSREPAPPATTHRMSAINFYNQRFQMKLTPQEKQQLVAFLNSLW